MLMLMLYSDDSNPSLLLSVIYSSMRKISVYCYVSKPELKVWSWKIVFKVFKVHPGFIWDFWIGRCFPIVFAIYNKYTVKCVGWKNNIVYNRVHDACCIGYSFSQEKVYVSKDVWISTAAADKFWRSIAEGYNGFSTQWYAMASRA